MRRRGRSASSISTMEIMGAVIFLFVAVIVGAFFFAPDKPTAPPGSVVSYAEPPKADEAPASRTRSGVARQQNPVSEVPVLPDEFLDAGEEAPNYRLSGRITEARTGEAVRNALIHLRRTPTPAENERLRALLEEETTPEEPDSEVVETPVGDSDEYREELKRFEATRRVRSDANGDYEVNIELEGSYTITVRDQRYLPEPEQSLLIVPEEKTYTFNAVLSMGASVTGTVRETDTRDAAQGIQVVLGRPRQNAGIEQVLFGGMNDRREQQVETGQDGTYTISGLVPGEYSVSLQLSNTPYRAEKVLPYRTVHISGPDQEVKNVDFTVDPAGIVWGYIMTQDDEPARADVVLCTDDSLVSQALSAAMNRAPPISGRTDAENGYYELMGIPLNKEWRLYATSGKRSPQMTEPFILTPRARSARVDITMFNGTDIMGRVVDTVGEPVAGAEVICFTGISKIFRRIDSPPAMRDARSDQDGYFHIEQLPAGQFQIHANKQGYKFSARGEPVYVDGYNNIENFVVTLHPIDEGSESIFGHVVDGQGRGISGARVGLGGFGAASFSGIDRSTTTGADGGFLFEAVEVGSYVLNVNADGYSTKMVHRVRFNEENLVELEAGAMLAGTVYIRETGRPLDNGQVSAIPVSETGETAFGAMLTNGPQSSGSGVGPDGSFEISVRAGRYRVEARRQGLAPGRVEAVVEAGERVDGLRIYVSERGGSIAGRVVSDNRDNVRGTMLILIEGQSLAETAMLLAGSMDATSGRSTRAGEDGTFQFDTLGPGVYNIIAMHPNYPRSESGMLELANNQNMTGVELRLGGGGGIEGFVYRNQQRLAGATVMAMANGLPEVATADDNGFYHFDGLAPGSYQMLIVPEGIGDLTNIGGLQSVTVEVFNNRVTQQDLGDSLGGARIVGICDPKPDSPALTLVHGLVQLRPQSMPPLLPIGASAEVTAFLQQALGNRGAMISADGTFEIANVPPGSYSLDAYYPEGLSLRFVSTQPIEVPDTAEEIPVTVEFRVE